MKLRQVFVQIWRVNAVLILLGGLLSLGVMGLALISMLLHNARSHSASQVMNIDQTQSIETRTRLGNFARIEGTNTLRAPLHLTQDYEQSRGFGSSSYSKEADSLQNYLFFNELTRQTYWLKPPDRGLIWVDEKLLAAPAKPTDPPTTTPVGFVYLVITTDSNQDRRLTEKDRKTLAISDANGERFALLIENVDEFHGASGVKDQRLSVFYTRDQMLNVAELDLKTQKVLRTTSVPRPQGSQAP